MPPIRARFVLLGAALAFAPVAGCGGGGDEKAELAKLEPPPASRAPGKAAVKQSPPPKFGSPPRSSTPQP
jgi:hypothetical protein